MEIFGFAITFLSIVIAIQTWRNGKWMKEMLKTIHKEGEKRHQQVIRLLEKMDERMEKRHQEVITLFEKMDERTAKIAELIERTSEK